MSLDTFAERVAAIRTELSRALLEAYGIAPSQLGTVVAPPRWWPASRGPDDESSFRAVPPLAIPVHYHDEDCPCDDCRFPWSDACIYLAGDAEID